MTLALARAFYRQGHKVYVADTNKWHVTNFSNSVAKSFVIPSPRFHPEECIASVLKIVKSETIDLLIPTFEETFLLAKAHDRFPKNCELFFETFDKLHPLHNKYQFNQKLISHGMPAAPSYLIKSQSDLTTLPFTTPYILKPSYSRSASDVHIVDPKKGAKNLTFKPHNPFIAQEFIEGKKFCSYSVCIGGKVTAHAVYPVKFAIKGSGCVSFSAIDHPEIRDWVMDFVKKEAFTGQIAFDFIQKEDGTLFAIECNPRATFGLHLLSDDHRFARAFFRGREGYFEAMAATSRQITAGMLLYGWQKKHRGEKNLSFLRSLFSAKDTLFCKKDIKPFLMQPLIFAVYVIKSLKMRLSLPAFFTHDIDWNNEGKETPQVRSPGARIDTSIQTYGVYR